MRRLFSVVVGAVLVLGSIYSWQYLKAGVSACDQPITYRLGQLDPRFNLTDDQARQDIEQATEIWNLAAAKKLFKEGQPAKLTVSFIYDQRQALSTKIQSQENNLNTAQKTLDTQIADFLKQEADYNTRLGQLNAEINGWNQKGGAPPEVYRQLQDQAQNLKTEGDKLQNQADNLNQNSGSYNYKVNQLNAAVGDFNAAITQRPEGGLFDGAAGTISIYLDPSHKILIHTLAHEFGHALGIGHLDDPKALMYAYTGEGLLPTPADRAELIKICRPQNRWRLLLPANAARLRTLLTNLTLKLKINP